MQIVGTPIVARSVNFGRFFITRSTSNRKKKYQSGRGTYVVVVGLTLGPSSAPNISARKMITHHHDQRHDRVLDDRIREERLALVLQDRVFAEVGLLLGLVHRSPACRIRSHFNLLDDFGLRLLGVDPWRSRDPELGHEIDVESHQRSDQTGDQQHVDRVEP